MISIWFRYDFDVILICQRLWFSYGFGVSPFSWYDFLMVLESLRFLDMISYGFGEPPSFWYDFVIVFVRPHLPPPSRRRIPATPPTPLVGPQPHLPPLSPDSSHTFHPRRRTPATPPTPVAGPTSHPVARQWNHWGTLWFQTLVSFWFFWISRDVAACYRPTEFSLNISFTILWVRLARRRGFQCCCKLSLGFSHSFHIPLTSSFHAVVSLHCCRLHLIAIPVHKPFLPTGNPFPIHIIASRPFFKTSVPVFVCHALTTITTITTDDDLTLSELSWWCHGPLKLWQLWQTNCLE